MDPERCFPHQPQTVSIFAASLKAYQITTAIVRAQSINAKIISTSRGLVFDFALRVALGLDHIGGVQVHAIVQHRIPSAMDPLHTSGA